MSVHQDVMTSVKLEEIKKYRLLDSDTLQSFKWRSIELLENYSNAGDHINFKVEMERLKGMIAVTEERAYQEEVKHDMLHEQMANVVERLKSCLQRRRESFRFPMPSPSRSRSRSPAVGAASSAGPDSNPVLDLSGGPTAV